MDSTHLSADEFSSEGSDIQISMPSGAQYSISHNITRVKKRRRLIQEEDTDDSSPCSGPSPDPPPGPSTDSRGTCVTEAEEPSFEDCASFYRLEKGTLPSIDDCNRAGGTWKDLTGIPIRSIPAKRAMSTHFYSDAKNIEDKLMIYCRVLSPNNELCTEKYSKTTSTSVLLRHIMKSHKPLHDALQQFRQRQDTYRSDKLRQPSWKEACRLATSNPPSDANQKSFRMHITRMIATSLLPMSTVENPDFRGMIHFLNPKYQAPSRATIRNDLGVWRASLANQIEDLLQHCTTGSFTADTWTSNGNHKFLGVTFYWITPNFKPMEIIIGMESVREQHTGNYLRDKLREYY